MKPASAASLIYRMQNYIQYKGVIYKTSLKWLTFGVEKMMPR